MYRYLLTSVFALLLFSGQAISNEESVCPNKYFQGNASDLIDVEIGEPYRVENGDYNYDVRFYIFPVSNYHGLEFYGGAIQHGFPKGTLSFMDFSEKKNDKTVTSIFASLDSIETLKIRLWFSSQNCHMTAAFLLTEIDSVFKLINARKNKES